MKFNKEQIRQALEVYAITDRSWLKEGESLAGVCGRILARGGATMLQLREKDMDPAELEAEARQIQAVCAAAGIPFIVNDDLELAIRLDADGVHLGQDDLKGRDVRALLGPDKILGITAKTVEQARAAEAAGADYLGSGAVFGSSTKKDAKYMSRELLREITASVEIPVVAIGGITAENLLQLSGCGIAGAAVVSGIFAAEDPQAAARQLRAMVRQLDRPYAIFDMDGTLVDSLPFWQKVGPEYLAGIGYPDLQREFFRKLGTMTMSEGAAYFVRELGIAKEPKTVEAEMNAVMEGHYRSDIPAFHGIPELLEVLKQAGVRMAVASTTAEPLIEACLTRLGLAKYFEYTVSCETVGAGKESSAVFDACARHFGAEPAEILVYEDSAFALRTAEAAGYGTVDMTYNREVKG